MTPGPGAQSPWLLAAAPAGAVCSGIGLFSRQMRRTGAGGRGRASPGRGRSLPRRARTPALAGRELVDRIAEQFHAAVLVLAHQEFRLLPPLSEFSTGDDGGGSGVDPRCTVKPLRRRFVERKRSLRVGHGLAVLAQTHPRPLGR